MLYIEFYPLGKDEPAKEFSLAPLLKVETIEANTVKSDETLSKAYNKIVSSYIKNNNVTEIDNLVGEMNLNVKNMVDSKIKNILQSAVSSIEATNNLKMNLHPDVTLEKIFINSIIYEYQEGNNNIPESQFGMGYTNLMVIIANIVDYIQLYSENDINGSVNILCIEEPESFMHPQMQELFIKNIAKAIAILLGKKGQLETFQMIITTHSPHIVNSKIHSGNTLNNIIYLGQSSGNNIIRNLNDRAIIDVSNKDEESKKNYEYIKKYLRLELSDIFFADAIILVEGVSEETYIRYEIDKHPVLKNNHIKVYRIDGAYAHQFLDLIGLLGIKTIVYTDLDLKRNKEEKQLSIKEGIIPENITNLKEWYKDTDKPLSTNTTLLHFIKEELKSDNPGAKCINDRIISMLNDEEELIFQYDNAENITLHSQGKINGYYATSFEEAIILTNGESNNDKTYKESLIKLLQYVHPKTFEELNTDINIINKSYGHQIQLSDGKSKFSTGIVYFSIVEESFSIKVPKYIQSGLDTLVNYFEE
ncbi:ATP-dependent nuclease [Staphylococcus delphini]|uniref:ATP-dependent nuclease n=1 Tax=Staphylococcus delphini TaxID=53344 RepID=UPI0019D358DB|nr:AAA family ATPase [Staphylococcus delphini]